MQLRTSLQNYNSLSLFLEAPEVDCKGERDRETEEANIDRWKTLYWPFLFNHILIP